jgi:hypothetical protein
MWECTPQPLNGGRAQRFVPQQEAKPLRYRDVLRLWQDDETFRAFFISLLAKSTFSGFRWETPPVTATTADREFEFVLLDTPGLNRPPDERAFAEQFRTAGKHQSVVALPNLGNDAVLIVPRPSAPPSSAYVHLASFVRQASPAQVHELWQLVGATMAARLSANPTWLSTAGMGVSWLHVRLDERPKYYGYAPYRDTRRGPLMADRLTPESSAQAARALSGVGETGRCSDRQEADRGRQGRPRALAA